MSNYIFGLALLTLISCNKSPSTEKKQAERTNTIRSIAVIRKDSARLIDFRFEKKALSGAGFSFTYANEDDSFVLVLDSVTRAYRCKFGGGEMLDLELEGTKHYEINGKDFTVLKLIGDKNLTDGAFTIFLSPDFGLLASKSNTWRFARVLCPDKNSSDYLQQYALLYSVQTDEDFFHQPIPKFDKKLKVPKVE